MRQVTAVLIGAGLRGSEAYASYALNYPCELKIVAVAEPDEERRRIFSKKHDIPKDKQFVSYKELLGEEPMADCALVCTQDTMHYEPVMKALGLGYHVLCEKPMSPNEAEIMKMGQMAEKAGRILSICHVLRYSPFFVQIKKMLNEGKVGRLMNIQHIEEVGYWHHAHSFVRGNWRNAEESSPMILAKCCHDMDILLWLTDSHCREISSSGQLSYFKKENTPPGAPHYCMDGCIHRDTCPFYAPKFYLEHKRALVDNLSRAVSVDVSKEAVLEKLKTSPYGRCVFQCDNTVVDQQTVNITFDNDVHVSFDMCAFTYDCKRKINLMGTHGQIIGDMEEGNIVYHDFITGNQETIHINAPSEGHGGSDAAMMKEFVALVASDGKKEGKTNAADAVESHLMSLAAERSRVERRTINFNQYKKERIE